MKKKIIVPIVLSSIGLLIGGLIYLGISSFPELLESEKSIQAKEANAPVFVNNKVVAEDDALFEPVSDATVPSIGGALEYVPSSIDGSVTYIDAPSNSYEVKANVEINKPSWKDAFIEALPTFEIEYGVESFSGDFNVGSFEASIEQPVIVDGHSSYSSYAEKTDETARQEVNKTKKARVNKTKSVRSNEALIETTLLVIGAVDIFSMVLIHRRKHLFR